MTDWEKRYRDGDTPWDKGQAAPPLAELIERLGSEIFGDGLVCVPGCGAGHDVRLLASHGLQVLGVDVAESAIQLARSFPFVAAEDFLLGDFLEPASLGDREFSAIWEHTCFCAIDPSRRRDYAAAAARLLVPGGVLAGVFFLTPYDPGEVAKGPPFESTAEEIDGCLEPWFEKVEAWVPQTAYPGRAGREWLAVFRRKPNV